MIPDAHPRQRVATGAELLDLHVPGWVCHVDVTRLDLLSLELNLLVQLDEYRDAAPLDLGAPHNPIDRLLWEVEHGLRPSGDDTSVAAWAEITSLWIEAIAARRAELRAAWDHQLAELARGGRWLLEQREAPAAEPEPLWHSVRAGVEGVVFGATTYASVEDTAEGYIWRARHDDERIGPCLLPDPQAAREAALAWLRARGAIGSAP